MMYIYADNAATTKISPAAMAAMTKCMEEAYGNPSSLHSVGQKAAEVLQKAREDIAEILGADFGRFISLPEGRRQIIRPFILRQYLERKRAGSISFLPPSSIMRCCIC